MIPSKITFSDYRRFLVSFGLAMVVASVAIPWLVISGTKGLLVGNDVSSLTATSKYLIESQQDFLLKITQILPWFSLALCVLGIACSILGLRLWITRQKTIDRREDVELERQEFDLSQVKMAFAKDSSGQLKDVTAEISGETTPIALSGSKLTGVWKEAELMAKILPKLQHLFPNAVVRTEVLLERADGKKVRADFWLKTENVDFVGEMKSALSAQQLERAYRQLTDYVRTIQANYAGQGSSRRALGFMAFPSKVPIDKNLYEGYPIVAFNPESGEIWNEKFIIDWISQMQSGPN